MIDGVVKGTTDATREMRRHAEARLESLRSERTSWWTHWREVGEFILPRRSRWLITPNQQRGMPINTRIINGCATRSAQTLASGLMSGVTSPSRPWFKLSLPGEDLDDGSPAKVWLDEVTKRMTHVMADSNYYTAKATQYLDLAVFGTAPMIIYEDYEDVIRCFNPVCGEYFLANGPRLSTDTLAREFTYSVSQVVREFGLENCSDAVSGAFKNGGGSLKQEVIIGHVIEPNDTRVGGALVPKQFPYRETFWEVGSSQQFILRARGFHESPFSAPRWDVAGNDAYGRSPGMEALGESKQLQIEEVRKAEAIDKGVRPPMIADVQLKNEPASLLPGGVTYIATGPQGVGFKPSFEVNPQFVNFLIQDIQAVEQRIKEAFFVPLFLMISDADKDMTAYEVAQRREEKLVQLGPVLERNENEGLDPDIDRIFAIMNRAKLFPPPPAEIQNAHIKVEYVSMMAAAQRAASTTAIEQLAAFAGNLAGAAHDVLDNIDTDEMIEEYADALGVPAKIIRATQEVMKLRAARQQQTQQQAMMQQGMAAVQGAQTLSQTPVGGGQTALSMMLGTGGEPQGAAA
jgi:hypothetical protein